MSASLYKLPRGESVFNYGGNLVYAGADGWVRAIDVTMEKALVQYGAMPVGAPSSVDAVGGASPLQIPRDGGLGGGGGGAVTSVAGRTGAVTLTSADLGDKGSAGGVATLDGGGKVPTSQLPSSVLGGLNYQGTYNATTNSPAIVAGNKGFYWKVSVAGTSLGHNFIVGDWAVDNGTSIDKVDGNENEVQSVAGRTGAVVLSSADLTDLAATITGPIAANTAALSVQTNNPQIGTTYTFVIGDAGQNVDLNNASPITATIPPHSAVPYPNGTMLYWTQVGAGAVTIAGGAGVTLPKRTSYSYATSEQLAGGYAYQVTQDNWRVYNS